MSTEAPEEFSPEEAAEANQMLDGVRAVLEGRDPDMVSAVLAAALLGHVMSSEACQTAAQDEVRAIAAEALEQLDLLWPQREVLAAGGLN